jgi:hypothetical protein
MCHLNDTTRNKTLKFSLICELICIGDETDVTPRAWHAFSSLYNVSF